MLQTDLEELAEWCCIWFSATAEIHIKPEISDAQRLNVGLWPVTRGLWPPWWFGCGVERGSIARGDELQGGSDMSCQESGIMSLCVLRFQPLCSSFSKAYDLHSTTMISLHMEAFAFSTAAPEIPHRRVPVASPRNTTITNPSQKKGQAWLWNQVLRRKRVIYCIHCSFLTSLAPWFYLC